jgi:hypothetical protein
MKKLLLLLAVFYAAFSFAQINEIKREESGHLYLKKNGLTSVSYNFTFSNLNESEANLLKEKLFGYHQVYIQEWSNDYSKLNVKFASDISGDILKGQITSLTDKLTGYARVQLTSPISESK